MRRVGEIAAAIGLALLVAVGVYIGIPVHPPDPGPALPSGIVAFADASPKSSPPPSFQIPPVPSRPAASAPSTADPPAVGTAIMSVRMTRPQTTGRRGEGHVAAAHPAATVAVQPRLSTATPPPITSAADQHPVPLGHRSHPHSRRSRFGRSPLRSRSPPQRRCACRERALFSIASPPSGQAVAIGKARTLVGPNAGWP